MITFIQRAVGYSLVGQTTEQCLFILIGNGANGKSTLLNAVDHLFGGYAAATPMQTLTVMKYNGGQTNDLASLVGKRFVSASDGEAGQRLAESKIKNMTGGDPVTCRALYQNYFTYVPQFKLWVATNDLPKIDGTDEAIWRRIRVIEFNEYIPPEDRDPNLGEALKGEAAGILNWALAGYDAWQRSGLNPPAAVIEATGIYREENDLVAQFINARCELDTAAKTSTKDLYDNYQGWSFQSGGETLTKEQFGKALKKKGFAPHRACTGNGWKGLRLSHAARLAHG